MTGAGVPGGHGGCGWVGGGVMGRDEEKARELVARMHGKPLPARIAIVSAALAAERSRWEDRVAVLEHEIETRDREERP